MADFLLKDTKSKDAFKDWLVAAMGAYGAEADLKWEDEDTLTEHFFKSVSGELITTTGKLKISSYKTRGRGPAAAEKKLGADGICIVNIQTAIASLHGFFLFQAKKVERSKNALCDSSKECSTMLSHTAASYLLVLMRREAHMAGAMAVHSHKKKDPPLNSIPYVSFPRFVDEQLLHGLMLEPMFNSSRILTPDLTKEIRHVLTIVGSRADAMLEAQKNVVIELEQMGLSVVQRDG